MDSRVQPIAVVDVVEALTGALRPGSESRSYDVGGPERMPYTRLLDVYAAVAGLSRPQVVVPGLPTDLVGTLAGAITDLPGTTVEALVESLAHDMVCHDVDWTYDLLPDDHELVGVEESFARALAEPDESVPPAERDPLGPMPGDPEWAGGQGGGLASTVAGAQAVVTGSSRPSLRGTRAGRAVGRRSPDAHQREVEIVEPASGTGHRQGRPGRVQQRDRLHRAPLPAQPGAELALGACREGHGTPLVIERHGGPVLVLDRLRAGRHPDGPRSRRGERGVLAGRREGRR